MSGLFSKHFPVPCSLLVPPLRKETEKPQVSSHLKWVSLLLEFSLIINRLFVPCRKLLFWWTRCRRQLILRVKVFTLTINSWTRESASLLVAVGKAKATKDGKEKKEEKMPWIEDKRRNGGTKHKWTHSWKILRTQSGRSHVNFLFLVETLACPQFAAR